MDELKRRELNQDYKIWKKNTPFMYDMVMIRPLIWPSLTVQWMPDLRTPAAQILVLGTCSSGGQHNYLTLTQLRLPLEDDVKDVRRFNLDPDGNYTFEHLIKHAPPSIGLDEALIDKIAVYKYEARGWLISCTDCSVCLSEFREGESLRLLPKCSHAFHLQCIDVWLKSHLSCPIFRATIMSGSSPAQDRPLLLLSQPLEPESDGPIEDHGLGGDETIIVVVQDGGGEIDLGNGCDSDQCRDDRGSQPMRRSFSMCSSTCYDRRLSIADVFRVSMEDEFSRHCVKCPVTMKRSISSGMLCFKEQKFSTCHWRLVLVTLSEGNGFKKRLWDEAENGRTKFILPVLSILYSDSPKLYKDPTRFAMHVEPVHTTSPLQDLVAMRAPQQAVAIHRGRRTSTFLAFHVHSFRTCMALAGADPSAPTVLLAHGKAAAANCLVDRPLLARP